MNADWIARLAVVSGRYPAASSTPLDIGAAGTCCAYASATNAGVCGTDGPIVTNRFVSRVYVNRLAFRLRLPPRARLPARPCPLPDVGGRRRIHSGLGLAPDPDPAPAPADVGLRPLGLLPRLELARQLLPSLGVDLPPEELLAELLPLPPELGAGLAVGAGHALLAQPRGPLLPLPLGLLQRGDPLFLEPVFYPVDHPAVLLLPRLDLVQAALLHRAGRVVLVLLRVPVREVKREVLDLLQIVVVLAEPLRPARGSLSSR